MAAAKRWRLICYDVRDPRRWRDVYRVVGGVGHRVQYSVYRARLDDQQVERLRWELAQVMAVEDALLIVDLCPRCASNVISRNHVEGWSEHAPAFRVFGGSPLSLDQATLDEPAEPDREFLGMPTSGEDGDL